MFNTTTGIIYAYNLKNPDSGFVLQMIAHFSWLHVHGEIDV
uniref:Plastocyanin-like domain-containing protein n=1 Tax=Meloidogyne hapla TaxID=6305 RepID=A0A1I8B213_MELHA